MHLVEDWILVHSFFISVDCLDSVDVGLHSDLLAEVVSYPWAEVFLFLTPYRIMAEMIRQLIILALDILDSKIVAVGTQYDFGDFIRDFIEGLVIVD